MIHVIRSCRGTLLLLLVVLLAVGCTPEAEPQPASLVVALFDLSANDREVRDRYIAEFRQVLDTLPPGSRVVADVVTESTARDASLSVDSVLPQFNWLKDNEMAHRARSRRAREALIAAVSTMLTREAPNSDIIGAFAIAEKVLKGRGAADFERKSLIVFSDGIHQTPELDFTHQDDLSDEAIERIISAQNELGRLPDLAGVDVFMTGTGRLLDDEAAMTLEKLAWVKRFWLSYVSETSASMDPCDFGPALTNWPGE